MRFFFFFILTINLVYGQSNNLEYISDKFEDFSELPREQIFSHVNKSTFITGESIWFKTYVFSRDLMEVSEKTSNIYCVLLDKKGNVVKKKMILGYKGFANGEFLVDSTMSSGEYIFKTYTNWSKNFEKELTHHESYIKIINPKDKQIDKPRDSSKSIDVQLLPESGHLLANVNNKLGVIAKDSYGNAVKNLRVKFYENGIELDEIELNHLGINTFNLVPKLDANYKAVYYYNNQQNKIKIPSVENKGIVLHIDEDSLNITIQTKTNKETLKEVVNKKFFLTVHNSIDFVGYEFVFQNEENQSFILSKDKLFSGINIFTLFNQNGEPIAERMFFNFEKLKTRVLNDFNTKKVEDSLIVSIPIKDISENKLHSLSASILPSQTKSYKHNDNIVSSFFLTPYLRGPVDQISYFFIDTNDKKKKELDCLLLTQGWSRYDWNDIFNNPPKAKYNFEIGINYTLSSNYKKEETVLIYPNYNSKSEFHLIKSTEKIKKLGFFPMDDDKLRIGKVNRNNSLGKSDLIVNFYPNNVPVLYNSSNPISVTEVNQFTNQGDNTILYGELDKIQVLDEVKLIKKKEYTRIEKLQNKRIGKVYDFDEKMKRTYRTFAQFMSMHGFIVQTGPEVGRNPLNGKEELTFFRITPRITVSSTKSPLIFLNDVYLTDYNFLENFSMETVDYVEINKGGIGEGLLGSAGVIRIYTDPQKGKSFTPRVSFSEYKIPLTFSRPKKFYSPRLEYVNSQFFIDYGAIDWRPNLNVENGYVSFKIQNSNQPVNVYIEGVIDSEILISEIIAID